jgi:hypothetical protein
MEHRPNSESDTSTGIRAESPILSLTEHYVLTHATNQWDGPKYVTYSTKGERLRYLIIHEWSHVLEPAPNTLSDPDFFFTGKIHIIF